MEIDFLSQIHNSTTRDYLARVNDPEYPKAKAAELAKLFDYDYWDGDRRICYGGYRYIPDRWKPVAEAFIDTYKLDNTSRILDVGCGKGFLMYELKKLLPSCHISGIDISSYAIQKSKPEVAPSIIHGTASSLPFADNSFDFVYSINTLHCLHLASLISSLSEIERVSSSEKYICVESYRNESEKANLLYWQVTCEAFHNPTSWLDLFKIAGYTGDHSFIYFT